MKRFVYFVCVLALLTASSCVIGTGLNSRIGGRIIDHEDATVEGITDAMTKAARDKLRIVYWHTSHGSQIPSGLEGMDAFYGSTGRYVVGDSDGPFFDDRYECDIGNPEGGPVWYVRTSNWLNSHPEVNVVMWSWCGQVGDSETDDIVNDYITRMTELESAYPNVVFVYMTGHANGTGLTGDLHRRNQIIRNYCIKNGKWLYDFYDIECYNPDGKYFGDKNVNDNCDYDTDGNGSLDGNWATEWQTTHQEGQWWWDCSAAHSQAFNGNQKAKAVWQLWCAIAQEIR
jgi:hypothetical protein